MDFDELQFKGWTIVEDCHGVKLYHPPCGETLNFTARGELSEIELEVAKHECARQQGVSFSRVA